MTHSVRAPDARTHDNAAISMRLFGQTGMTTLHVDERTAFLAGEIRARRYERGHVEVSLPDCFAVAASLEQDALLATADQALTLPA